MSGQFLDLNLFKPRIIIEGEYLHQTSDSSLSYWNSGVNYMFPIKSKLGFKANWADVLLSGSIKEAVQKVRPKAYQIFGNLGGSYQNFINPRAMGSFQSFSGGISGVYVTVKNKKLRSILFASSIRITQPRSLSDDIAVNPSLFLGTAFATSLKSFWAIGGYGTYFGNRILGTPVLIHYNQLLPKLSLFMVLPAQVKLTWKVNKKLRQSAVVSYFGDNFRINSGSLSSGSIDNGIYLSTGFRFSTQSKIKIAKKSHLYLEMGWQSSTMVGKIDGNQANVKNGYAGSLFSNVRLNVPIGKALLNSENLDFGL